MHELLNFTETDQATKKNWDLPNRFQTQTKNRFLPISASNGMGPSQICDNEIESHLKGLEHSVYVALDNAIGKVAHKGCVGGFIGQGTGTAASAVIAAK